MPITNGTGKGKQSHINTLVRSLQEDLTVEETLNRNRMATVERIRHQRDQRFQQGSLLFPRKGQKSWSRSDIWEK